jgi:hypothetical protein
MAEYDGRGAAPACIVVKDADMTDNATPPADDRQDHYAIPGDRDTTTLTHRERGAMSAPVGDGGVSSPEPESSMDAETVRLHRLEGGGT